MAVSGTSTLGGSPPSSPLRATSQKGRRLLSFMHPPKTSRPALSQPPLQDSARPKSRLQTTFVLYYVRLARTATFWPTTRNLETIRALHMRFRRSLQKSLSERARLILLLIAHPFLFPHTTHHNPSRNCRRRASVCSLFYWVLMDPSDEQRTPPCWGLFRAGLDHFKTFQSI
jgi:hypothetical protein